jgi:predicted RND superfamily exporter protein
MRNRTLAVALMAMATLLAFVAVTLRLRLDPNVSSLLPKRGEAASLSRYVRGFGGGDLAVVLIEGEDAEEVAAVAAEAAEELSHKSTVERAAHRVDASRALEPMLLWRHADAAARARLAQALSPEGMRERLEESRKLLLAPGSGAAAELLAKDPLRLGQLLFEPGGIGSGVRTQPDGAFATDDGRAHLVMIKPAGIALRGEDARAFVRDANGVIEPLAAAHPNLRLGLTGGHAIAAATEEMLNRDLTLSGTVAMLLASLAFVLVFRRARALVAVMPPLLLGTIWTAGLATLFPGGLSAIAVAFMSVVIGVGVDTGVHVYAALLEARRAGLAPNDAAASARRTTAKPVLFAAVTAGAAFAALALSDIEAVRQLGILCAGGEILTAIAIVLVTPEIGARLERGEPPPPPPHAWTRAIGWLTAHPLRAGVVGAVALLPIVAIALGGAPSLSESIVAVRPAGLQPLVVQERVFAAFGGKRGQWVVLTADADLDKARERSDRIAEHLASRTEDLETVDALTALAPAPVTQAARFDERDALDLPEKADELEAALTEVGFAVERFRGALDAMRAAPRTLVGVDDIRQGAADILLTRYLGFDDGEHLVALYLRPTEAPGATARIEAAIAEVDPGAMLTGYSRLESTLRSSLSRDLPLIGLVAGLLTLAALVASLRRLRDVLLAALVVTVEVASVLLLIRVMDIPLHAYDALVLPVLLGITVDEAMFLLFRARAAADGHQIEETLREEGPPVAATALTTAAGFGALATCDFDGLADLGAVGALGSIVGLVVALVIVPAGLRVFSRP